MIGSVERSAAMYVCVCNAYRDTEIRGHRAERCPVRDIDDAARAAQGRNSATGPSAGAA